jgi:threonine/homoserine/homoserine lactone efflux protein
MNMWTPVRIILAVIAVFTMGFAAAVPIGPTQFEIARRSLHGYFTSALMIIIGQLISDVIYGSVALFGIAPFLQQPKVIAIFWLLNAIILVALAVWSIRQNNYSSESLDVTKNRLKKNNIAFFVGFSLAFTNPLMIVWWLLGSRILIDLRLIVRYTAIENIAFLGIGALGIGSYLTLLAFFVYRAKGFLSDHTIHRITMVFSVLLIGLAAYLAARSAFLIMR